ncbi:MAG: MarR family transcriptional regulator [Lachnospiraceae bacterium]|nr:MarR family transcriptional regulator [Lachnospiraceae bacterium]
MSISVNGLTSIQTRILGHLRQAQEENRDVFQRDIEEVFRIKRSSVTSVLQTLEKKELIVRESIPEDARLKKLVLTDKAIKMQRDTYHIIEEMEQEVRSMFSEQEFEQFLEYMSRIDQKATELYSNNERK